VTTAIGPEIAAKRGLVAWWDENPGDLADARRILPELTLDTGETWAGVLQSWQSDSYAASLQFPGSPHGERRLVWVDGPAGCGKDQVIAAIVLALLHRGPKGGRWIVYSTDHDRAKDVRETTEAFCRRDDRWGRGLRFVRDKILREDRDVEVLCEASDGASASGSRADGYIFNEVQEWKPPNGWRVWAAAMARRGKKHGVVSVFANAPFTPKGEWRRDRYEHARTHDRWHYIPVRIADCPWITPDFLSEQRGELPPVEYRRLYLCKATDGRGELVTKELLDRCVDPEMTRAPGPTRYGRRFLGIDIGVLRDHAALCLLCLTPDGRVYLERMDVRVPAHGVDGKVDLDEIEALGMMYGREWGATILPDPHQARHMMQHFESAGIAVAEVVSTATNLTEMAHAVMDLFRDRRVRIWPFAGETEVKDGHVTSLGQQLLDAEVKVTERGVRMVMRRTTLGHGDLASAFGLAALGVARASVFVEPVGYGTTAADRAAMADGDEQEAKGLSRLRSIARKHMGKFTGPRQRGRRTG